MKKTLAIVSLEKEVGKSTLALNLAHSLNLITKQPTFLLDLDFHNAGITKILGLQDLPASIHDITLADLHPREAAYKHASGFYFVPNFCISKNFSSSLLAKNISKLKQENSLAILDSNSGKGMLGSLEAGDEFIIVSSFSKQALEQSMQLASIIESNSKTVLGIVFNKTKTNLDASSIEKIELALGRKVLAAIPEHKSQHDANLKNHPMTYLYPSIKPTLLFKTLSQTLLNHSDLNQPIQNKILA